MVPPTRESARQSPVCKKIHSCFINTEFYQESGKKIKQKKDNFENALNCRGVIVD